MHARDERNTMNGAMRWPGAHVRCTHCVQARQHSHSQSISVLLLMQIRWSAVHGLSSFICRFSAISLNTEPVNITINKRCTNRCCAMRQREIQEPNAMQKLVTSFFNGGWRQQTHSYCCRCCVVTCASAWQARL